MENDKMSAEGSSLLEAKNKVAQMHGYADWFQIDMTDKEPFEKEEIKASMLNEVAKEYASQQTTSLQKQIEERDESFSVLWNRFQELLSKIELLEKVLHNKNVELAECGEQLSKKDEMMDRMAEVLIKLNDYFFCEKPLEEGEYYDLIKSTENVIEQYQNSKK